MDKINVLVLTALGEANLRRIAEVNPRIKVIDGSHLWDGRPMTAGGGKLDFSNAEFDALLAEAEIIYGFRIPYNTIARAPKLKWIQIMVAGANNVMQDDILKSRVILTNASGIHSTPISETTIGMMLLFAKQSIFYFQSKLNKRWEVRISNILRDKTVGIIGLGSIGKEVARLCKAFGMKVIATRRSAKKVSRARYVDVLLPKAQLNELLSQSDYVVMAVPSTAETNKMIGEKEFKTMKPTAYLINIGRGNTIDEEALIRACEEEWIAGAGLDVFTVEPLPAESKLWVLPNVYITPHVSGRMEKYGHAATGVFCENLRRYISGKRLLNIVNRKRGY